MHWLSSTKVEFLASYISHLLLYWSLVDCILVWSYFWQLQISLFWIWPICHLLTCDCGLQKGMRSQQLSFRRMELVELVPSADFFFIFWSFRNIGFWRRAEYHLTGVRRLKTVAIPIILKNRHKQTESAVFFPNFLSSLYFWRIRFVSLNWAMWSRKLTWTSLHGCKDRSCVNCVNAYFILLASMAYSLYMWGSRGGPGPDHPPPLENHKNIGFHSNSGPDPLKNHKAT